MKNNIKDLMLLLDDTNVHIASAAMAELLESDINLDSFIKSIQEDDNPILRKRAHQLQVIQTRRNNREKTSNILKDNNTDIITGLSKVHTLWYDNDTIESIMQFWLALVANLEQNKPDTIDKFAYFLRKTGFKVSDKSEIEADYFCLGIVLEELIGSDFLLCAIAQKLAKNINIDLKIINNIGDFILIDKTGMVLSPRKNWSVSKSLLSEEKPIKYWNSNDLLRLTSTNLYLCAITSDSFRYINTIGKVIADSYDIDDSTFLPYPYSGKK